MITYKVATQIHCQTDGGLDTLALGTFGPLLSNSDPQRKIELEHLKPHYAHGIEPKYSDLKERAWLS